MSSRDPGQGQSRVRVTAELIERWIVDNSTLPDDARLLDICRTDTALKTGSYTLVFESEDWDEQVEGEHIPYERVRTRPTTEEPEGE